MAITVWPVDAVTGAPSYTGRGLRETMSVLSSGATGSRPLGVHSGVRPGTSPATVTASSTTWTIASHAGILDLEAAAEASGYAYAINSVSGLPTGAVTAANATYPRVDIVWLRLDDPAESDGSSVPAVVAGYTAGVATSSPVPPATPARCMVLAWVNVPASGGGSPTVTWKAPYAVGGGAPIPVWSQAERDALTAYDGLQVYRLDLHSIETSNGVTWGGGAWITYTPTVVGVGVTSVSARWNVQGRTVTVQGRLVASGASSGAITVALPLAANATLAGFNSTTGSCLIVQATLVTGVAAFSASTTAMSFFAPNQVGASNPAAWASGNELRFSFVYEAA